LRILIALLVVAGCGTRPVEQSDWERDNRKGAPAEAQVELPAYPVPGRLVEFEKSQAADFHYFIDPQTLSVDKDGVVRYVLVARSSSGVQNVSYEGLRCESAEYRFYAFGRADGTWSRARSEWRSLQQAQPLQRILYADYFCPQKVAILNAGEGVRALRDGGHPFAKGFSGDVGRGGGR
jgi:CNP1-like family protein